MLSSLYDLAVKRNNAACLANSICCALVNSTFFIAVILVSTSDIVSSNSLTNFCTASNE